MSTVNYWKDENKEREAGLDLLKYTSFSLFEVDYKFITLATGSVARQYYSWSTTILINWLDILQLNG